MVSLSRLTSLIATTYDLQVPEGSITEETNLMADIGMDSLDVTELILSCQTTFKVNLDMATAANIRTIGDLLHAIQTASKTAS